jgi:hypothetical protein
MVDLAMSTTTPVVWASTATDHGDRTRLRAVRRTRPEAITIDDIAAAAGIGRRTLFRYYPSKNDILWGAVRPEFVRLRDHPAAATGIPVHRGRTTRS